MFRGDKASNAYKYGAVGAIIYRYTYILSRATRVARVTRAITDNRASNAYEYGAAEAVVRVIRLYYILTRASRVTRSIRAIISTMFWISVCMCVYVYRQRSYRRRAL